MKKVDALDQLNRKSFIVTDPHPVRVMQFGEGNFLRAFVDWQFDKMNKLAEWNTGVVIVQPQPGGLVEKLNEQDDLYTVILEGIKDGKAMKEHTVVECVSRGINPYGSDFWSMKHYPKSRSCVLLCRIRRKRGSLMPQTIS